MKSLVPLIAGVLLTACASSPAAPSDTLAPVGSYRLSPEIIYTEDGAALQAERGVFFAPSDYVNQNGDVQQIPFIRIKASSDPIAPPLFLLSGGPGNTYFDDILRDDFVETWIDYYREIGDIVILEQRGANEARPSPICREPALLDAAVPTRAEALRPAMRAAARACLETLEAAGFDFDAYSITAMADDFNALREALGYKSFNLKGGSYGSQLGLTILRRHQEHVHRAIFYGIEGPNDTYDLPESADAQLRRIAEQVAADPQLSNILPDFEATLIELFEQLENAPIATTVETDRGTQRVVVSAYDLKLILWNQQTLQGYRDGVVDGVKLVIATLSGNYEPLARAKLAAARRSFRFNAMTFLVDCRSSSSADRMAEIAATEPDSLLGEHVLDLYLHTLCPVFDVEPLGADFWAPDIVETQVLLIAGDLDAFTPPENAYAAKTWLPNAHVLLARRGDHSGWDVLKTFPELKDASRNFLAGEPLPSDFPDAVELPPLPFSNLREN